MALGGVDIGRKSAVEAEKPITSDTSTACSGNKEAPTGIKTLAAAVLLIMLDNKVVSQPKSKSITTAFSNIGICATKYSARPASLITIPSVSPPVTRISVSQGNIFKSSAPTTPVTEKAIMGSRETTATGMLCSGELSQSPIVITKVATTMSRLPGVLRGSSGASSCAISSSKC